jgi:hypothetical protein
LVIERTTDGKSIYAAIFPVLPAGNYRVTGYNTQEITVFPGYFAEIDWS